MACFTYLVIFHLKMNVYQYVNIPHNYGDHLEKHKFVIIIKFFAWFTHGITMFNRY